MRTRLSVWAVAACMLAAGPAVAQQSGMPMYPLAVAENEFAVDLYSQLAKTPGNLVFSPFSVANALDMVFLGAKGETSDQMAGVLHLQDLRRMSSADLSSALEQSIQRRSLFQFSESPMSPPVVLPDGFKFEDADSLWGANGEAFNPAYLTSIKSVFDANIYNVDFTDPAQAAARINQWVSGKTHGRITDLISASAITPRTKLVLTDAVYFKAGWAADFDTTASKPGLFHSESGKDVTVRMMHATRKCQMTRSDGMEMLEIPYRYGDASLLIILPQTQGGLTTVESELTADKLNLWLAYSQMFNVTMSVPAFKSGSDLDLSAVLSALGMNKAFMQNEADLSGIADDKSHPLYVSDVVHKAFIDVSEKGTEAAAATGALMPAAMGIEPPIEDVNFVADHPFIYVIRANGSGDILFMGRVENPADGEG